MDVKVSDLIDTLSSYLEWLEENSSLEKWLKKTNYAVSLYDLKRSLRLSQRICSCSEMFLLQDLPLESEEKGLVDQSLESFFDCLKDSINEKIWEIYPVCSEMHEGLLMELEDSEYDALFSSFLHVEETLKPLVEKTADKYKHTAQFKKHWSMKELLEFIQLISRDVKTGELVTYGVVMPKLNFLKNFIGFASSLGVGEDKMQDLFAHIEFVVTIIAYGLYRDHTVLDRKTKSVIKTQYSHMLKLQPEVRETYIRVMKESRSSFFSSDYDIVGGFVDSLLENHRELLGSKSNFTVTVMKVLGEQHRFLKNFLMYQKPEAEGGDLDKKINDLIREAGILIYSYSWDDLKEESIRDAELGLSNWMEKVEIFKRDVARKYPETSRYRFPRTNELGFMDGLLEDLKELVKYKPDSIAFAEGQMDVVLEDLVFLRDFLHDTLKQREEHEELKALWIHVIEVAYKIEFNINCGLVGDPSPDCSPTSFGTIKEEIKKIKTEVKEIYKEKRYQIEALNTTKISSHFPARSSNPRIDEIIVGFRDEAETIIDRLKAKSSPLDIISIVGMPGQGKTTLAKKVYHDSSIRSNFLVRAWCCVSQGYEKRKLLLDILTDVIDELPKGVNRMNDEDLEQILYKSLKGRRYLIVLDDRWEVEAWRDLQSSFPDDHNHSRILLTSRIHGVALQVKPDSHPHYLRLLDDVESTELLEKKLFLDKGCQIQEELRDIWMQITRICKGLPLALVTVAGILATMEQDSWEGFAKGLSTSLVNATDQCSELLELSYIHLPDYLKPCLLYFGSFLQDQEIPVSRLTWMWMAEGFVQKTTDEKSLENVAEDYLINLINRSLVMVAKRTSTGRIKACSVHDLVHDFCMTKAKEENFLQLINVHKEPGPLFEPRRLCIFSARWHLPEVKLCFRHLRSVIFFPIDQWSADPSISSSYLRQFKLVRILDLRGFLFYLFPSEVEMLVHLRYLALAGVFISIPSTIVKLWNLETLLLKGLGGEISLPYALLNLTKLRHLHVNRVVFRLEGENLEKFSESCNLETFCTLFLSSGQDMEKIFRQISCIRKLKCIFFGSWDNEDGYQVPALDYLSRLESLKVHSAGKIQYQLEFNFPSNLKKLTLSNFYLPWPSISRFAQLPNLEVLKLLNRAFEGESWDMEEEERFTKLQYLKFENLDIVHWNAEPDNFPYLRRLVLHRCKKLHGIPSGVGEVTSLEIIEVKWCHDSVAASAQDLEEEIEGLKAFIHVAKSDNE